MEYSAREIAALVNGTIEGYPDVKVNSLSKIEEGRPNTLSFMGNPKYEEFIYNTQSSVVIVNRSFQPSKPVSATLIRVDDAYQAFAKLLEAYNSKNSSQKGIEQPSYIASDASLGSEVYIGAFSYVGKGVKLGTRCKIYPGVYIGNHVELGDDCVLHPGVKIYQNCKIGNRVIIHANAVIGADGFGYTRNEDKSYTKVSQIGNVIIEDDVEIGANTTIDSATLGSTIIRKGVKLDNLIQIAHNVEIGEHTAIASLVGISGSTKIGKRCVIAGQVGITGHVEIADDITIGAQAGVTKSFTKPGINILGAPAYEADESKKIFIATRRLPELMKKIANLEAELAKLKKGE
ncbi:MAG: UDP-3-O-(3-hydroxymyristoyl)glucosamine N-acyltransferase [Flavobacteriales bacterium]|nr:UDP-3-O-(3-hydroxymyristoyl)glucosamine N-acyltransferase [Flavobacteriales bacterium]